MLGVNLVFAGFALSVNGVSYFLETDDRAKGFVNLLVGVVIGLNALLQTISATSFVEFGFAAAMWLFSLNYFILAAHLFLNSSNWAIFGLYGGFAALVSVIFMIENILIGGPWEMGYMWGMWAILWLQGFIAIVFKNEAVDKLTPHILIINGLASTFIPGILILLGIIFN